MTSSRQTVRLDFCSTFEMVDFVQTVSDHIGRLVGLDDDALHWVGVAVRESVIKRELLLKGAPGSPAGQAIVAAAAKHLAG